MLPECGIVCLCLILFSQTLTRAVKYKLNAACARKSHQDGFGHATFRTQEEAKSEVILAPLPRNTYTLKELYQVCCCLFFHIKTSKKKTQIAQTHAEVNFLQTKVWYFMSVEKTNKKKTTTHHNTHTPMIIPLNLSNERTEEK